MRTWLQSCGQTRVFRPQSDHQVVDLTLSEILLLPHARNEPWYFLFGGEGGWMLYVCVGLRADWLDGWKLGKFGRFVLLICANKTDTFREIR